MPIRAYWTSCRISPGDCENTKHLHSCLQRLHRQPKQTRRDPNAWRPPSVGVGDGQQTVNTDQDKDLTPKPRPPPSGHPALGKVPCYHGERAEARASHCWAPSSGVSRTHPVRGQMSRWGAAGRGHQSAACHPLTSANTETNWDGGRRRKRGLHLIHLLNRPAGPTTADKNTRADVFVSHAQGRWWAAAARGASTVHVSVSPSCGEARHLKNRSFIFIYKAANKCRIKDFLCVILLTHTLPSTCTKSNLENPFNSNWAWWFITNTLLQFRSFLNAK